MSNMKKLDLDDLDRVTGGCIVVDQNDYDGKYFIVRDGDGMIFTQTDGRREDVIGAAHDVFHTSGEIITPQDYAQRYGRALGKY